MRDQSKPIRPPLPADFGAQITAAKRSQDAYDKHVAPIVAWALAECSNDRRKAYDLVIRLRNDDATSDTAFDLLGRAATALQS